MQVRPTNKRFQSNVVSVFGTGKYGARWTPTVSRRDRPGGCGEQNGFPGKCCLSDTEAVLGSGVRREIPGRNKTTRVHLKAREEASPVGTEGVVDRNFRSPNLKWGSLNKLGSGQL